MPVEHLLIAGDTQDLDNIRAALSVLPTHAYGQVYVSASADLVATLSAPARMTIHRVDEETGCLSDAVAAWVAEWVPDEHDPQRSVTVWIGSHAGADVDRATWQGLDGLVEHL